MYSLVSETLMQWHKQQHNKSTNPTKQLYYQATGKSRKQQHNTPTTTPSTVYQTNTTRVQIPPENTTAITPKMNDEHRTSLTHPIPP